MGGRSICKRRRIMKLLLKRAILVFLIWVFAYFIGALHQTEFHPFYWDKGVRTVFGLVMLLIVAFTWIGTTEIED